MAGAVKTLGVSMTFVTVGVKQTAEMSYSRDSRFLVFLGYFSMTAIAYAYLLCDPKVG